MVVGRLHGVWLLTCTWGFVAVYTMTWRPGGLQSRARGSCVLFNDIVVRLLPGV
jgi:hypothetical protein